MTYNAARHFTAKPDGHGGVRLSPRFTFRDQPSSFLPKTALVDEEGFEAGPEPDTSGRNSNTVRNTVFIFTPAEHETYEFEKRDGGMVAVVLSTPAADYPGQGGRPSNGTTDRRTTYLANSYGRNSEAAKLATLNANNRRYFGR